MREEKKMKPRMKKEGKKGGSLAGKANKGKRYASKKPRPSNVPFCGHFQSQPHLHKLPPTAKKR
jgi:hypothetical protein